MASYFFTDLDQLFNQPSDKEFGKITNSGVNSEKFQITSFHNCQVNAKAYAITDGLVMVQQNSNNQDLVNIILKPLKQSIENISIAYFVYRGVKKESLFQNSLIVATGNDLALQIHNTIATLNQKYPAITHTPEEYILAYGDAAELDIFTMMTPLVTIATPGGIKIDDIFNLKDLKFKPFIIRGGAHIGSWNSEFGMDVILEEAKCDLNEVRKGDNFITSLKTNSMVGEALFDIKTEREKILNYFDICQFYSVIYEKDGFMVKNDGETFGLISSKSDSDNKIVEILNHFNNGDTVFIDIRNEFNNSLNYQDNISGNIILSFGNAAGTTLEYPLWPLFKVQVSNLDSVSISIPKSDFTTARSYFRKSNKDSYSFKAVNFDGSNHSSPLKITLSKSPNGTTLSSYYYLMFLKEIDHDLVPTEWVVKPEHFVDTMFDIEKLFYTDATPNLKIRGLDTTTKPTKWKIHNASTYVFKDEHSFIAKTGVAEDAKNFYLFGFSNGDSLKISSVDLKIVDGASDAESFLDDILLPEFNNSLAIYSYYINDNGINTYVLKDNSTLPMPTNSRLSPDKNDFVMIAIDKYESAGKLKVAYLQFANNLPKRLKLKAWHEVTLTGGKKYWKANIFLVGYGNNTTANSFEVLEIDTDITVFGDSGSQRFFGTNRFNELYVKNILELNAANVSGVLFKNLKVTLRSSPITINLIDSNPANDDNPTLDANYLGATGLENVRFNVLGKCIGTPKRPSDPVDENNPNKWYYVELLDDVVDSYYYMNHNGDESHFLPKGTKCFFHSQFEPYLFAKFDRFIDDFKSLNDAYDIDPVAQNDSITDRVIRIRQRGHNSDVWIFNFIMAGDWFGYNDVPGTINKNEIPEVPGETFDVGGIQIQTNLQMFRDYSGVKFYNQVVADLQHLFVGMEVLDNIGNMELLHYGNVLNYNIALYSGDAGSVPAQILDWIDEGDEETSTRARDFIKAKLAINRNVVQPVFLPTLEGLYFSHFQNVSFPDYDMAGDFYGFGMHKQLKTFSESPAAMATKTLIDTFNTFNGNMDVYSEEDSLKELYRILGLNPDFSIGDTGANAAIYDKIRADTISFGKIWFLTKIRDLNGDPEELDAEGVRILETYSRLSISYFIDYVNNFFFKFQ